MVEASEDTGIGRPGWRGRGSESFEFMQGLARVGTSAPRLGHIHCPAPLLPAIYLSCPTFTTSLAPRSTGV